MKYSSMTYAFTAAFLLVLSAVASEEAYRAARLAKLNSRPRTVIWNNDGCDMFKIVATPTPEELMKVRNAGLIGTNVEVLSYCTVTAGLGMTTSSTKIGEDLSDHPTIGSVVKAFQALGTDALKESLKFAHEHGMEGFWSIRMNDCHDSFPGGEDLFPKQKKKRPDLLIGSRDNQPPFAHWTAYDYGKQEVRDWVQKMIVEVMENYEVDGVELDFCRHWAIFKSAAYGDDPSREELDAFTGFMKNLRSAADRIGAERGRTILLSIRIMDSVEACLAMGLDVRRWFDDGLVDIVCGGSEIRLNHPDYMGKLAKQYPDIRFYMTTTDAQIKGQKALLTRNNSKLNYRAQAASAYVGGVHGIYSFNEYHTKQPYADYLREIGDREALKHLNKCYYFSHSYLRAGRFGKDWDRFQKMPILTPEVQMPLAVRDQHLELYLGEEAAGAHYRLLFDARPPNPEALSAEFNGVKLGAGKLLDEFIYFEVPERTIKTGLNIVTFRSCPSDQGQDILSGQSLLVYGVNQGIWRRFYGGNDYDPKKSEAIVDGAYLLRDVSEKYFSNLARPLDANEKDPVELSFEAKVLDSDDPDAIIIRIANSKFTETVQFMEDGVAFKHARLSSKLDTKKFRRYRLLMENNVLSLFADGEKCLSGTMSAPFAADDAVVTKYSHETPKWLNANSIILGSLSPKGKGGALFRKMTLKNAAEAGRLYDGALMVIHDEHSDDLPPQFKSPLSSDLPESAPSSVITLPFNDDSNYAWRWISANAQNHRIEEEKLFFFNQQHGPTITHALPAKLEMLEIDFTCRPLDTETPLAQIQVLVILDDPKNSSNSLMWGYRIGREDIKYFDDTPKKHACDGEVRVKILIDPESMRSDLHVGEEREPLLRNIALTRPKKAPAIFFGDGSVAVEGSCEILQVVVKVY